VTQYFITHKWYHTTLQSDCTGQQCNIIALDVAHCVCIVKT